jgi:hypothetical protein
MKATDYYETNEQVVPRLTELRDAIETIDAYARRRHFSVFWRGQMDYRWPLTSSLVRKLAPLRVPDDNMINDVEDRVLAEAGAWITDLQQPAFTEPIAKLAYLQHHGIPTRLIDFTRNPWVALFFASESMDDVDGRLFAVMVEQASVLNATPSGTPWRTYSSSDIVFWDPTASGVSFARVAAQEGVLAVGRLPSTQPYRSCIDDLTQQRRAMLAEEVRRILSIPFRITGTASSLPPRASPPIGITFRVHVDKESIRRDLVPRSAGRRISPGGITINHTSVYPDAAGMVACSPLLRGLDKGILIP